MYRLVSPNYNGAFEFNAAKNGGIQYFDIYCTYKPYSPYISVKPNFGGLYGKNFEDARGLICGGDFSLAQVSDAWANYELGNKNYQAVFDRQIQNMEAGNAYQRVNEAVSIATGAGQAGFIGAGAGALIGGPVGAAVGGLAGGLGSGLAGIADFALSEGQRREALDYAKDQFGYQLQNVRAIPQSLSRSSALTANNKLFPTLEYYTCTEKERQALRDKVYYDGMTVMRIGTISEFLQPEESYIKGRLIRLEGYDDRTVREIADEIYKGVFI